MQKIDPKKYWDEIAEKVNDVTDLKDLNEVLDKMHLSDAHVVLRDMVDFRIKKIIAEAKYGNLPEYQRFQAITIDARNSFTHDRTTATMIDVDKAVSKSYMITLRMIAQMNASMMKISDAINAIEQKLDLPITNFQAEEGKEDDTTNGDVEGSKEDIK